MNTIIEESFPAVRRRSLTTLDGLLRNTVAESFLSYITGIKNHRKSLKESEEAIKANFKKMNSIVSKVDEHIARRLENHEKELFWIVKGEIQAMKEQTKEMVEQLNMAITKMNNDDEIWSLNNQLDYFKAQTLSIFNQNKQMKQEIATLRGTLKQMEIEIANGDALMQKLKKKYMRENFIKEKILAYIGEMISNNAMGQITLEKINEISKVGKGCSKLRIKTLIDEKEEAKRRGGFSTTLEDYSIQENQQRLTNKLSLPHSFRFDKTIKLQTLEKGIQTQTYLQADQQTYRIVTLRHFSNTSYVQAPQSRQKRMSILKNNLALRKDLKKMARTDLSITLVPKQKSKDGKHMRYMSLAFNKNKVGGSRSNQHQSSTQL